jgi:hypothetical protein
MQSTYIKIIDVMRPAVVPRIIPDWIGYEAITELRNSWLPVTVIAYTRQT